MFGNWTTVLTTQLSEDVERVSENRTDEREGGMEVQEDASSVILPGENYWPSKYLISCFSVWICLFDISFYCTSESKQKTELLILGNKFCWKAKEFFQGLRWEHAFVRSCAQSRKVQHNQFWDSLVHRPPSRCIFPGLRCLWGQRAASEVCAGFTWARCNIEEMCFSVGVG